MIEHDAGAGFGKRGSVIEVTFKSEKQIFELRFPKQSNWPHPGHTNINLSERLADMLLLDDTGIDVTGTRGAKRPELLYIVQDKDSTDHYHHQESELQGTPERKGRFNRGILELKHVLYNIICFVQYYQQINEFNSSSLKLIRSFNLPHD